MPSRGQASAGEHEGRSVALVQLFVSNVYKWVGVQDWQGPHLEDGSEIITKEAEHRREVASYPGTLSTELHPQVIPPPIMITKVTFRESLLVPLPVRRTSGSSTETLHSILP